MIPSLQVGGSERVMATLANEMAKDPTVDVDVVTYGRPRDAFYALSPDVRLLMPPFPFDNDHRRRTTLKTVAYLRRTLRDGGYDAALSFGERWNSFVMLASWGLPLPVVLSDRSSPSLNLGRAHTFLREALYPRAAGLMAQTSRAREVAMAGQLNASVAVVPNPVLPHARHPAIERENIVVSVGRMVKTKHQDRLIQNFAAADVPGWRLFIVGDDAQRQRHRERLEALTAELGVADRVVFTGALSDVGAVLDRARLFAFTSSVEGFPNAVAEALAAGLPVVSYACDAGPADLIHEGRNGFLVDVFDDKTFVDRLRRLMSDDRLRAELAKEAAPSVAHLHPARVAEQVLGLLNEHVKAAAA